MTWAHDFASLLAVLFKVQYRSIVERAMFVDIDTIDVSRRPTDVWFDIIRLAHQQARLQALVDVVLEEYPKLSEQMNLLMEQATKPVSDELDEDREELAYPETSLETAEEEEPENGGETTPPRRDFQSGRSEIHRPREYELMMDSHETSPQRGANIVPLDSQRNYLPSEHIVQPEEEIILRVDIGPFSPRSIVDQDKFPDIPGEPKDPRGHPIDVMVSSTEFTLEEGTTANGRLYLPPNVEKAAVAEDGGRYLYFSMSAPIQSVMAFVRVSFYYQNNLLRSYFLESEIGGKTSLRQRDEPDYNLSGTMTNLLQYNPRLLSIFSNEASDQSHTLTLRAENASGDNKISTAFRLEPGKIQDALLNIRKELFTRAPKSKKLSKKQLKDDLMALAPLGWQFYSALLTSEVGEVSLRKNLQKCLSMDTGGKIPVIHVARSEASTFLFTWGLAYDIAHDSNDPQSIHFCPVVEEWNETAPLVPANTWSCPKASSHRLNTLCPFGFWGFRYAIEQPASVSQNENSTSYIQAVDTNGTSIEMVAGLTQSLDRGDIKNLNEHINYLASNLQKVTLTSYKTRAELKDGLADPNLHLLYFYCHGEYDASTPHKDTILSVGKNELLTGDNFIGWLQAWDDAGLHVWDEIRPLVFINACHSVEIKPETIVPLLVAFVKMAHAAGVIGTEVRIGTGFAIEFAQGFFDAFVNQGASVKEAMHNVKLDFLNNGNLFGLVYTPYCSADLHLRFN